MDILLQLFRQEEINKLVEENDWIRKLNKDDLRQVIRLLANERCNNKLLRNIIQTNPEVLGKNPDELEELILKFKEYNIIHLDKVFDTYPYILNKKAYMLDTYFFIKEKEGLTEEEISKMLEEEPYKIEMTS